MRLSAGLDSRRDNGKTGPVAVGEVTWGVKSVGYCRMQDSRDIPWENCSSVGKVRTLRGNIKIFGRINNDNNWCHNMREGAK